jgi:hypothetical protein
MIVAKPGISAKEKRIVRILIMESALWPSFESRFGLSLLRLLIILCGSIGEVGVGWEIGKMG